MKNLLTQIKLIFRKILIELQEVSKNCPNETRWVFITILVGTFFSIYYYKVGVNSSTFLF